MPSPPGPASYGQSAVGMSPGASAASGAGGGGALPVGPNGREVEIAAGGYRAVVTEVGATLRLLTWRGHDLLMPFPADAVPPGGAGCQLLPWPNRVAGGRYRFGGGDRQLALTEAAAGNAIHGLVRRSAWAVAAAGAGRVVLTHRLFPQPGYPHVLDLAVEYTVDADAGLAVRTAAHNVGASAAPFGAGSHPYLAPGGGGVGGCVLTVPARERLEAGAGGIPTGRVLPVDGGGLDLRAGRVVGDAVWDDCLTGLERGADGLVRVWLDRPPAAGPVQEQAGAGGVAGVELWADAAYRYVMVFTGDTVAEPYRRAGVAVEPMTCPPNALATGVGVIVLEPGGRTAAAWGVRRR